MKILIMRPGQWAIIAIFWIVWSYISNQYYEQNFSQLLSMVNIIGIGVWVSLCIFFIWQVQVSIIDPLSQSFVQIRYHSKKSFMTQVVGSLGYLTVANLLPPTLLSYLDKFDPMAIGNLVVLYCTTVLLLLGRGKWGCSFEFTVAAILLLYLFPFFSTFSPISGGVLTFRGVILLVAILANLGSMIRIDNTE